MTEPATIDAEVVRDDQDQEHPPAALVRGSDSPQTFAVAPIINTLEDAMNLARVFGEARMFKGAEDKARALAKILAGRELGVGPIRSLTGFHVYDNQIAPEVHMIASQIRKSGRYDYEVLESTNEACRIRFHDFVRGWKREFQFDTADAKQAGLLGKSNWTKYPRAMRYARALTEGARVFCPDVFGGAVYTVEELGSTVDAPEEKELNPEPATSPEPEQKPKAKATKKKKAEEAPAKKAEEPAEEPEAGEGGPDPDAQTTKKQQDEIRAELKSLGLKTSGEAKQVLGAAGLDAAAFCDDEGNFDLSNLRLMDHSVALTYIEEQKKKRAQADEEF